MPRDDVTADLVALVRTYAETVRLYGAAILNLLTEVTRQPELHEAMAGLMPNLLKAAQVTEAHQERGNLAKGDPMQTLWMLIGPLMVSGLWARSGASPIGSDYDPGAVVAAFLDGHRLNGHGVP